MATDELRALDEIVARAMGWTYHEVDDWDQHSIWWESPDGERQSGWQPLAYSTDDGATWTPARAREAFPWHYPRGIAVKPDDPRTVYVTLGDSTPGRIGTVMRSRDAGATWQNLALPGQPNSAMWTVSLPAAAPDTVFAASCYGYLYRSEDGGDSWRKLWREFSEVSSVLWVPRS